MYETEITGIGSELQGVGRLPDGRAVFVPGAIPGETVRIEILRDKGRFCEASLVEVIVPSPDRIAPECPHYGICGGCQGRHMRYARTLDLKRQMVCDALRRIGGIPDARILQTIGSDPADRTRNKAEYPIAFQDGSPLIGTFGYGSRRVIPITDCLLQSPESIRILRDVAGKLSRWPFSRQLRFLVTRTNADGKVMVVLCGDAPIIGEIRRLADSLPGAASVWYCQLNRRFAHALDGKCTPVTGEGVLRDRLFDLDFELSPQSFFQVNRRQAEALYTCALTAAGVPASGSGVLRLLDAYCGVGTIALSAARRVASVTGIEIVPPAIENANRNAEINGIRNARFLCGDAAREIPRLLARGAHFDAVILDPPRKGADRSVLDALIGARVPTVSYVSCNPATLARDVRILADVGYRLQYVQPVDMFPWTGHVETVALLSHSKDAPRIQVSMT